MAMLPRVYKASTREKAEQALAKGLLTYPAFCYITSENIMSWVDASNKINYIVSDQQITNVTYSGGYLTFLSGTKVIEKVDMAIGTDEAERVVEQITQQLNLDEFAKKGEVATMIDNAIGDLDGFSNVADYIAALSYNRLQNIPVKNIIGSLRKATVLSALNEGTYCVKGPYVVGGENETVYSAVTPTFVLVSHDDGDSKITVMNSNTIKLYYLTDSGICTSDEYVTKSYLAENYMSTAKMLEYIATTIGEITPSIVKQIMEKDFDTMLSERVEAIPLTSVLELF